MKKPTRTQVTDLEERQAWDHYMSASVAAGYTLRDSQRLADVMLTERRDRFSGPQREHFWKELNEIRDKKREAARARRRKKRK